MQLSPPPQLRWLVVALLALALPLRASAAPSTTKPVSADSSPAAQASTRAPTAPAADPPSATPVLVDVYTMGPGDYFFSLFGHAAICITDAQSPAGRCYNWGTADFSDPLGLAWQVARGRAQFWVGTVDLPRLLSNYMAEDRSLYRQRLSLSAAATERLVALLHRVDERSKSLYTYHNLRDNCTTRVRDILNEASDGTLTSDAAVQHRDQPSFRAISYEGFAGSAHLIAGSLLLFGRAIDRPISRFEGMFLPRILREEINRQLHVAPEPIFTRKGPVPSGPARDGVLLLIGAGLFIALCVLLLARGQRTWQAQFLAGTPLGLIGSLLLVLRLASPLAELRYNEVLLLCWPSDLFLPLLPAQYLRTYLNLRLAALCLVAIAVALGVLRQPLWGPLLFAAAPLLAAWIAARRWRHDGAPA
ncbi:MAG: DUF4105 domain-containing protein [Myxococcales bacterium]|nr:DUF4105 domain-containing protein [Myxococcales bacterium]